jgi:ech hydrogenase subunit F
MSDVFRMFGVVARSLFKKTACEMYPKKPAKFYENTRGHISIEAPKCILCTLCAKKCPTYAITVDKPNRTWAIERGKCILCGLCVAVCPKKCLHMENQHMAFHTERILETVDIPEPEKES